MSMSEKCQFQLQTLKKYVVFLLIQMLTRNILTRSTDNKFRDLK